ncbi:hypothetical protein PYW08_010722 [Mythimna loreyi]|uniref:Uncharacterized protein n=1 Tax=Mythimna loreyi TaxID=667449 RepID=A0ACC2Q7H9_9NEOP|nr:hypothetical protein PYW08_010722 [Mythimna loreyi]
MADNDTSTEQPQIFVTLVGESAMVIIAWILFTLTLIAAIYGVISWCIIKKFRHFRNYVILSAIVANLLRFTVFQLSLALFTEKLVMTYPVFTVIPAFLMMFCSLSFHCWLLVLCYIFYVDFVKVFNIDIRRRYLKSSLFAWGLPSVTAFIYLALELVMFVYNSKVIITYNMFRIFTMIILLIPAIISFVIYIVVLNSLFRGKVPNENISSHKMRRFYIATLLFILSNIIVLTAIPEILQVPILAIDIIGELGEYLNTIALNVYIIIVKSNRMIWREFLDKIFKRNTFERK